jgi:CBS domain-containing protein
MSMEVDLIVRRKNRKVVTVTPNTTMVDAAKVLSENRIGLLMVVGDEGKFVGVLSERDIVKAVAGGADLIHGMTVDEIAVKKVVACRPQTTVSDVFRTMSTRGFRHMPVIHEGKVVGVVSLTDVLLSMAQEPGAYQEAMQEAAT